VNQPVFVHISPYVVHLWFNLISHKHLAHNCSNSMWIGLHHISDGK